MSAPGSAAPVCLLLLLFPGGSASGKTHDDLSTVFIDSMALRYITSSRASLVRVTDPSPAATITTVSGVIPVECIGDVGLNVTARDGSWHYFEIPGAYVASGSCEK